jgi:G3E family GTPase
MIGGFLGAGKTTAMGRLARHLSNQGLRVGLITNDQAGGLVDTRLMRSQGFATEEIAGGCFCCRFNTLVDAAANLTNSTKPDVFIAEPVGSCTDLVATVTYPLRRMYGSSFTVAPLSVLVDPTRARRMLGLEQGGNFSAKVAYIYRKQLEEADVIVINKQELLTTQQLDELTDALETAFPDAFIIRASAREATGLDGWFDILTQETQGTHPSMEMDYRIYADGEALLGWLNATVTLKAEHEFDANVFLKTLASAIQSGLQPAKAEVAHLKMTYSPDDGIRGEIASVNLVHNDNAPESGMILDEPSSGGQLILNLRAEADPDLLLSAVRGALETARSQFAGLAAVLDHEEHFRPGKPVPTHRDSAPGEAEGTCALAPDCCQGAIPLLDRPPGLS